MLRWYGGVFRCYGDVLKGYGVVLAHLPQYNLYSLGTEIHGFKCFSDSSSPVFVTLFKFSITVKSLAYC